MTLKKLALLTGLIFITSAQVACVSTAKKKKRAKSATMTETRDPFSSENIYFYEKEEKSTRDINLTTRSSMNLWKGFSKEELKTAPFSMSSVREVTSANSHQIAGCYQKATTFQPQQGQNDLHISFSINNDGKVVNVETLASPFREDVVYRLNNCLKSKMVTWKFPSPDQEILTIEQTFTFGI